MVDQEKIRKFAAAIDAAGPAEVSSRYYEAIDALSHDSESFLAFAQLVVDSGRLGRVSAVRDRDLERVGRLIRLIDLARESGGGQG